MLILCGNWLGKKGFYEAEIEDVKCYQSLSEIREVEPISFVIFSYDLSSETLDLKIKRTDLPSVIILKIKNSKKSMKKRTNIVLCHLA